MASNSGCPFLENNKSVSCFSQCKGERLAGQWKICVDSTYDPQTSLAGRSQEKLKSFEAVSTGLSDKNGQELFEIYQSQEYYGSCYAISSQEALVKAETDQLLLG